MDWQSLTHLWGISAVWFKYRETEPSLVTPTAMDSWGPGDDRASI